MIRKLLLFSTGYTGAELSWVLALAIPVLLPLLIRERMNERYWIGGFFVDVPRNQITHNQKAQTLPPKALAVLTHLAERQGEVVSQDDLLNHVWKGTVVSPNTLQRCIAQLRRAFGDDGKAQSFIKTHSKKGYSLESNIRWEDTKASLAPSNRDNAAIDSSVIDSTVIDNTAIDNMIISNSSAHTHSNEVATDKVRFKTKHILITLVIFISLVAAFGVLFPSSSPSNVLQINDMRLLTSTDNRELASAYSPDGKFIVFQRFPEVMCSSHIWAKNVETQQEFQLTEELGQYGSLTFSEDGSALSFVMQNNCSEPVEQKKCFQLQQIDFAGALLAPQTPTTLMECKNTEIKSPKWIGENQIALLQKEQGRWRLIRYSVGENESTSLYEVEEGSIVSFDFSRSKKVIALIVVNSTGVLYIEKLTLNGDLLSRYPVDFNGLIPKYNYVYPKFSPIDDHLIFSTGKQLYTLSFEGKIQRISIPLTDAIGTPIFHPNGKKMLAIKGHYDSDIVSIPLSQFPPAHFSPMPSTNKPESLNASVEYETAMRSMLEESSAKYQPNGELIAFSSERDGTSQVWIASAPYHTTASNNDIRQVSQFQTNTYIRSILWAEDGESIIVNASSQLKHLYLDGREELIELGYPVRNLFHWDSKNQTAVANIPLLGKITLVEINLINGEFKTLSDREVTWATKTNDGVLLYTDNVDRFWKSGVAEHELIPILVDQGSDKRFTVRNDTVYGINNQFQLWKYSLENDVFNLLGQLPDTVDDITDVNDQAILITHRIAARKDVVELTVE